MANTMEAVVCHGPGDYRVEQAPMPVMTDASMVLRTAACGICASDIKCYDGAGHFWGSETRRPYVITPVVPGHEFSGYVESIDPTVAEQHGFQEGDLVVVEQIVPCWQCRHCTRGNYWMCQVNYIFGFKGGICDGGMATHVRVPRNAIVHKVPAGLTAEQAAYVEPLGCALHAVERGEIEVGDTVVVAGMGNIGLCMLQAARLYSPGKLIGIDLHPRRRALATEFGADVVLDPTDPGALETVLDLTDGYGCDVYIEATGHPSGVTQGLDMIRKLGTFVEFSVFGEDVLADWTIIGDRKEINIHGAHLSPYTYPLAMDLLLQGKVSVDPLISHTFPISAFSEAIEAAHNNAEGMKVMIVPE